MKELQITAIENGTVIDHLPSKQTLKIMNILKLDEANENETVTVAFNLRSGSQKTKGIIKIANRELNKEELEKIALLAPNVTVNIIKDYKVVEKVNPDLPNEIKNIVKCGNQKCITNAENIETKFIVDKENDTVKCFYCERITKKKDIIVKI